MATFTVPPDPNRRSIEREKRLNLFGFLVVLVVILVAVSGMAGVRTATSAATSPQYTLEVLHASVTRPGLATPFQATVRSRTGPLPQSVTLRIDSDYLAMFDEHGLTPTPVTSHSDSERTWWTFRLPEGSEELTVALDARLEPSVQWRRDATVALVTGGDMEAETRITTWVMP